MIGAGLDSTIVDAFDKTAVHYARENEYFEAARWCWLGKFYLQSSIKMINSIERTSKISYKCSIVAILQSNVKILEALNSYEPQVRRISHTVRCYGI